MKSPIYLTISRILFPTTVLFGAYIAFHGHLTPGGAFPAGVVLASALLMRYLSQLDHPIEEVRSAEEAEDFAVLMILAVISTTLIDVFISPEMFRFIPGHLFSAAEILMLNLIGAIKVGGAMTAIVVAFFLLGGRRNK